MFDFYFFIFLNYTLKMRIFDLIKKELNSFSLFEKIFFPIVICIIFIISYILKDNKIALVSAFCGITYTILAGKGKIYCYFIGIIGTFCYCYLSFKNQFYGNLALYALYFLPMELLGIFKWKKHLKKQTCEIFKTTLNKKELKIYSLICFFFVLIAIFLLKVLGGKIPYIDGIVVVLSIFGQILTIKRCIEQWYLWFFVNLLTLIMWIVAYFDGSNCFATIIMWAVYLFLSVYFWKEWKKDIKLKENI